MPVCLRGFRLEPSTELNTVVRAAGWALLSALYTNATAVCLRGSRLAPSTERKALDALAKLPLRSPSNEATEALLIYHPHLGPYCSWTGTRP